MPRFWSRSEVALGMVVTRDDIEDAEPLLYKVVGIWDEPVVVIKPLYDRDGDDREHYAVSSPLFHQVRSAPEPGAFTIEYR